MLRKTGAILLLIANLAAGTAPQVLAQEQPGSSPPEAVPRKKGPLSDTEEAIVKAIERTLDLLSRTFDSVTSYGMPEVLPNGDIIIRRRPNKDESPDGQPAPGDQTIQL